MSDIDTYLSQYEAALTEARLHAREVYPEESVGFIAGGYYVPLTNRAKAPSEHDATARDCGCRLCSFEVADEDYLAHKDSLQVIVHSHPNGPAFPSASDIAHQEVTAVTWVILTLDQEREGPVTVWGGDCPIAPLIGRDFIHGITDCYSLIQDIFALGAEGAAAQGVEWPLPPIALPIAPRDDGWWEKGDDLYMDNYLKAGFVEVDRASVQPGDVFFASIHSDRLNHGGVLLPGGLILHHLPKRLSRREPAGIWARAADKWVRYVGNEDAS